jgi:hypothetical protein
MPTDTQAETQSRMELRSRALAANSADLPHLEGHRLKLDGVLGQLKDLKTQQASLTAAKQEISRRFLQVLNEGQKLMTFLDTGVREHYGNRSEKLVEFGQQPFRSQPRIVLVGLDGQRVKKGVSGPARPAARDEEARGDGE